MDFCITGIDSAKEFGFNKVVLELCTASLRISFFGDRPRMLAASSGGEWVVYSIGPGSDNKSLDKAVVSFCRSRETVDGLFKAVKDIAASFVLLVLDYESDCVSVVGDAFGSIPLYMSAKSTRVLLSSVSELLVDSWSDPFDPVSAFDMQLNERICFPFTAYRDVRQVAPTCFVHLTREEINIRDTEWQPPKLAPSQLSGFTLEALHSVVRDSCEGHRLHVALSGGLDSRILLAILLRYTDSVSTFSITDGRSRDAEIARLVANYRGVPHGIYEVSTGDFEGQGLSMARAAGSQNRWYHGHLLPLLTKIADSSWRLLGGYGSNTNFANYDSVRMILRRVQGSELPFDVKNALRSRWMAQLKSTEGRFGMDGNRLAAAWPCTNKRAFAYYQVNRRLSRPLEPFMLMHSMFASKSMPDAIRPKVAEEIYRAVCADEVHLPVTQKSHPLGDYPRLDLTVELPDAGWPKKQNLLPDDVMIPLCLKNGSNALTAYHRQLSAVYHLYVE